MSIFVVATPLRYCGLNNVVFSLVTEALLRCRVVVVAKLKVASYSALEMSSVGK